MKTKNLLINIGLIGSLLFCMAFACGGGGNTNNHPPIPQNDDDLDTGSVLIPQTGVGSPYGARDPYACSDTRQPASGAITAAQAAEYIICSDEKVMEDHLYLDENLKLSIGGSVPDNIHNFLGADIDPKSPVYPIRASLDEYVCRRVTSYSPGGNCIVYPRPNTTGACAKTTYGNWRCRLHGSDMDLRSAKQDMPPPQ